MTKSKLMVVIVILLALVAAGGYYFQAKPSEPAPADSAQMVKEEPRNPISGSDGSFDGSIAAISSSTIDVVSGEGDKVSFVITPDVPVVRTTRLDASVLKGQLAVVSVRPGTEEAYSVAVFKDKKDLPAQSGDQGGSIFSGTIADVSPDSLSIKDAKGVAKSIALATTTQIAKIESLGLSSLREGDKAKVVWFMGEDNAPHVAGVYIAITYQ